MTQAEIVRLFRQIVLAYPTFRLPEDMAKEQVALWHHHLRDMTFETALRILNDHIATERFPPTIADLRRPLNQRDPDTVYHEHLRREAEEHFRRMEEYFRNAVPAPPEVRERMRQLAARRAYG